MKRLRLVHWNAEEAEEHAARLRALGFEVDHRVPRGLDFLREIARKPPDAVVIDLSRLPSQGRDLGVHIRRRKGTSRIPLLFLGGEPTKVARVRALLPDATFTSWGRIGTALRKVAAAPPAEPIVPASVFAAYADRPLPWKLGIRAGTVVGLVGAPRGFREMLGPLPDGAKLRAGWRGCDLAIWFVRTTGELGRGIAEVPGVPVWIAWRKAKAGGHGDLTQAVVRRTGLQAGLVDYKICSFDDTWSGLLFRRRSR